MSQWSDLPPFIGKYNMKKTIGKGSFSLVKEGVDTETHITYAVKIIPKSNLTTAADKERFEREVRVILKMNHPGIIKIHDFLVDSSYFYLCMELCQGETLLSHAVPGVINEGDSRPIFKQVLETICYIHEQGIAHRDLKLENVLIDATNHIKLIDFGFSRFGNPGEMFQTPCGSPAYAAPEVIGGQTYDGKAADMWSCGVVLFCLVTGNLPWKAGNQMVVFKQITDGKFDIPSGVSHLCQDLIQGLLRPDPALRLTAPEALKHPWLDGVNVSWDDAPGIKPALSEKTFVNIFTSGAQAQAALSPRTVMKQMAERIVQRKPVGKSNGSCSFGPRMPAPIGQGIRPLGPGVGIKHLTKVDGSIRMNP